jgi:hypothetical protein
MQHSVRVFRTAVLLAVLGLSAPAMAEDERPSASSTEIDPVLDPEDTTTTTSVGNPDGSRTVTTTDADGNVLEQHTVPGAPGPKPATLEEVEAEIERRAQEADEWLEGWDDEPGEPETGASESAVPPPTTDWERADDQLIDMEEQLRDLRYQHNELLDQAAETEDPEAFQRLVEQAQHVFEEMNDLRDRYDDQRAEVNRLAHEDLETVDMNAMGAEIESLEDRLEQLPGEIDRAETDEQAEALEAEAAEAEARLRELREQYDSIVDEVQEDAVRRAHERHLRATGQQGAVQRSQTPGTLHTMPKNPGKAVQTPQLPPTHTHPGRPGY